MQHVRLGRFPSWVIPRFPLGRPCERLQYLAPLRPRFTQHAHARWHIERPRGMCGDQRRHPCTGELSDPGDGTKASELRHDNPPCRDQQPVVFRLIDPPPGLDARRAPEIESVGAHSHEHQANPAG